MSSTRPLAERRALASPLAKGRHGGIACSHRNNTMAGGHSMHSDHDDGSAIDPLTAVGHQAPS
jgi:hypothetical protein